MNIQWIYSLLFLFSFALITVSCEWLHKKGVDAEYTRKIGHTLSSLQCLFFPVLFASHWYVLLLGIITFLVLYIGKRKRLFKSIDSVNRKTGGSYLLPVSIGMIYYFSLYLNDQIFFVLPLLILAISDSLASIFGKICNSKYLRGGKTTAGTIAFFLSTLIITCCILPFQLTEIKTLYIVIGIPVIATGIELFSLRGTDNLTVPLSVIGSLWLLGY